MSTVAVVTSQQADEDWVFRAIDNALVIVDAAPLADVLVVSADCLEIVDMLPESASIVILGTPATPQARAQHVITRAIPDDQLRALLVAIATRAPRPQEAIAAPASPADARDAQRAIAAGRKLATTSSLKTCETTVVEIVVDLLAADRAYFLYYDPHDGSLWSQQKHEGAGDDRRATAGLAGYAARTGALAIAERAGADPRFVGAIDDPDGDGEDHLLAQPVFGSDGLVHAVFVAARHPRRPAFGAADQLVAGRFARLVTPILDQLTIQTEAEAILDDAVGDDGLFRRQALAAQAMPRWGDVVRVSPRWLPWAYWLLVILLAGSAVFVAVAHVATYSTGPAVVRANARTTLTTRTAGAIAHVDIEPGEHAEIGTVVARLDDTDERGAVARFDREFEAQLRNHMLDPSSSESDSALRSLRTSLSAAREALEARVMRATSSGIVGDIRVRVGQHVEPGDIIATVTDANQGLEVVALLPGEDRPQLAPGMELRLELAGYRYVYQRLVIEQVSSDVIAPSEARRVLGSDVADGLELRGSVIVVRARLVSAELTVDGHVYHLHDGMVGTAEVRTREQSVLSALVPGTRRFR